MDQYLLGKVLRVERSFHHFPGYPPTPFLEVTQPAPDCSSPVPNVAACGNQRERPHQQGRQVARLDGHHGAHDAAGGSTAGGGGR